MNIMLKELLMTEDKVKKLSPQEISDQKLFGPVYHGTSSDRHAKIGDEGFKVFVGSAQSGDVKQGYEISDYAGGIPAPVHHLGFGVYFTTVKEIAKKFNHGTTIGLRPYFLNVPKLETINFGSQGNMMKWWIKNGYDYRVTPETQFGGSRTEWGGTRNTLAAIRAEQLRATVNLTEELRSKYDAVWFKGKSMYRLLDGDQVCVYDPNNIYEMDVKLAKTGEVGSRVIAAVGIDPYGRGEIRIPMGTRGTIIHRQDARQRLKDNPLQKWLEGIDYLYEIKWDKGGRMSQVLDKWIKLV